jgi:hemoglobin
MATPSRPIPGTPADRAVLTQEIRVATGLDEAVLERLVRHFYTAARQDALIGPVFAVVEDWETHIGTITGFWCSIALMTGEYHGRPMAAHLPLGLQTPHFARWLDLFEASAEAICPAAAVPYLMEKARRIADSFQVAAEVARGALPTRRIA